ncbi:hypothetical protein GM3708_1933 [Geminocystis sp. NIES-3708]|uniref:hypothetical protein n=1 Tax=Geminocystis sp. NIES-3708 TaxID=1615909 RepID=UPI0005FC62CB|nr:hypothetical protein [Geminocystis sp. NIES-3708]BAQ61527.1 hypothetical protein GM3708_1933 [Geminocystis sp. NIES-3708]
MIKNEFPQGWDEKRVKKLINYYENQSEDEAVAEDETVSSQQTLMQVPTELVPTILELINKYQSSSSIS